MAEKFLVGAAVGSGLAASVAERGGADFLLAINAGRMRNMGSPSVASSLPIADATQTTESFAKDEVLNRSSIPVYIGINVLCEQKNPVEIIDRVIQQGFDGVVNFPSVLHFAPSLQHILERAQRGFSQEIQVLAEAKSRGLKTLCYCANRTQARLGADAKLDMILLNFGWNAGGTLGHCVSTSLEEVAFKSLEIGRFIKRIHPRTKFLLEGGPIVTSNDLARVIELANVDGYVGGSTIERLPMEVAVGNLIADYRIAGKRRNTASAAQLHQLRMVHELGTAGRSPALLQFLPALERVATLSSPVFLDHQPGSNIDWVLGSIESIANTRNTLVLRPGVDEKHGTAARRLFGRRHNSTESIGALGDSECDLIVIHSPEQLAPRTQRRLARAIQDHRFMAIGSYRWQAVTTKCVFTSSGWTHRIPPENLDPQLAELLSIHRLKVLPLKDRSEDIYALIQRRLENITTNGPPTIQFQSSALSYLQSHDWPGNEQELYALVDTLALSMNGNDIDIDQLQIAHQHARQDTTDDQDTVKTEKAKIIEALWRNNFHRGRTSAALGVSRKTLYNKIRLYGLDT